MFWTTLRRGLHSRVIRMMTSSSGSPERTDADVILSGDGDLLDWPGQQPPVMKPAEFERVLTQK